MTNISASLVKELRERTGMGMMDCKQALLKAEGNIELAIEELRKSSGIKAEKKADRSAADGVIQVIQDDDMIFMAEINCETDFVAKDDSFISFSEEVINALSIEPSKDLKELMEGELEDKREKLVQKLGENIVVRRIYRSLEEASNTGVYLHSNKKIACVVCLEGGNKDIAKEIAMHAAATSPSAISPEDIPKELIEKEREIYIAQSSETNKPQEIINKMVEGKIKKFINEVSLSEQQFVKDPDKKIRDILSNNDSKVLEFRRFEVGEGVEIDQTDFATEVMSQLNKS